MDEDETAQVSAAEESALREAFLQHREVPPARHAELSSRLSKFLGDARAVYPSIQLPPYVFAKHLARALDSRDEPLAALELLRPAPLYLACACALGESQALQLLDRDHLSRIPLFISRVDKSAAFADEVRQILRAHLFVAEGNRAPGIFDYSGRGELEGWLRVLALRTAQRLRRKELRGGASTASHPELLDSPQLFGDADPERDHLKLRYRADYEEALKAALAALSVRERLFLKLHYVDGLNIDKIGRLYQLHRSTVARRIAEHRRRVLELTRERLRARLKLSDSEFESVLALVRSQLAISVRSALS